MYNFLGLQIADYTVGTITKHSTNAETETCNQLNSIAELELTNAMIEYK